MASFTHKFFPKTLSRKDKYRKSEWELQKLRASKSLVRGGLTAFCIIYVTYLCFHPEEETLSQTKIEKTTHLNNDKNQTNNLKKTCKLEGQKATIKEDPNNIGIINTVSLWDKAHNQKDLQIFERLYLDYILFYGKTLSREECITKKQALFSQYTFFNQESTNFKIIEIENGYVKCEFNKHVLYDDQKKDYPSYLYLKQTKGNFWKIEIESDSITDQNLKEQ